MIAIAQLPVSLESWMQDLPFLPGLLFAAVCLLILLLMTWPRIASWRRGRGRPVLDPVQVEELLLGSGALVVDLRSAEAFRAGHIRSSLHVPFEELLARFEAPDPRARRSLILLDDTDELSHRAYDLLIGLGFSWVYVLKGGMRAWRLANRPIAK